MGFSRQEYWGGSPCAPPGDLPDPGIEPAAPALAGGFITLRQPWSRSLEGRLLSKKGWESLQENQAMCWVCTWDRHLMPGVDVARCSSGQLPQPSKSQEWGLAQDGGGLGVCSWGRMDAVGEVGPFSAKAKGWQERRPRSWEMGSSGGWRSAAGRLGLGLFLGEEKEVGINSETSGKL